MRIANSIDETNRCVCVCGGDGGRGTGGLGICLWCPTPAHPLVLTVGSQLLFGEGLSGGSGDGP